MSEASPDATPASESAADSPKKTPIWRVALIAVGVLVMLFLVVAYVLPDSYHVERSIVIDAPPEEIHAYVDQLNRWPEWTVWTTERYPNLEYSYEGPEAGVGARQIWDDPETGAGHLEITESDPQEGIVYTMVFEGFEPLDGAIQYDQVDDGTQVSWIANGKTGNNPIARYFGLMMDSMIGADFAEGLAGLKTAVESDDVEPVDAPVDEPEEPAAAGEPAAPDESPDDED